MVSEICGVGITISMRIILRLLLRSCGILDSGGSGLETGNIRSARGKPQSEEREFMGGTVIFSVKDG